MRVYKSPVQLKPSNMQKKSSINFVKNVAAPKTIKTQNVYNSQHIYTDDHNKSNGKLHNNTGSIQKYRKDQQTVCLIIKFQNSRQQNKPSVHSSKDIKRSIISNQSFSNKKAIKVFFPYNSHTQIKNLISFVHNQVQNNMLYLKSDNIYTDYILGLKQFKVKELVGLLKEEQVNINNQNQLGKSSMLEIQIICCQYEEIYNNNYLKNFQIIKCVGSGGFSKVYLVRGFGKLMAMKVINKQYILSNDKANIINNEKTILSICSDHPFITSLYTSFQTKNFLIFVMQFCNGGELFNLLRKVRRMKQQDAKFYFVETLSAIAHLHRKGIVYRDIKPQNIIIDYQGHVRLADYGLSKIMEDSRQQKTYSFCGSAQYMAPQMLLKKGHSYEIDFYCLGALLYELVIGLPPYYSRNQNELFSNIIHNELQFPAHVNLSEELKGFLSSLLQKQTQDRYKTLEQILSDPWLKNIRMEDVLDRKLKPPFKTDMFGYNFDDTDFAQQQKQITQNLINQKNYQSFEDSKFNDFFYQSKQIQDIKSVINKSKQQGLFIRSNNNHFGEFIAESYHYPRNISNNGSIIMNKQSRQPSINRVQHHSSSYINLHPSNSVIITKRSGIHTTHQPYQQMSQIIYNSNNVSKINHISKVQPLHTVRSLQHLNTSKHSVNRSQERINSIKKYQAQQPIQTSNIYTTHKQQFHPMGMKVSTSSSSLIGDNNIYNNHSKNTSYIRQPNYYSVQKSNNRYDGGARLDIQNLSIKNQRNYSVERIKDIYSSPNFHLTQQYNPHGINTSINKNINNYHKGGHHNYNKSANDLSLNNSTSLKHAVSSYELKKSYIDGLRDKNVPSKVKKTSFKNGQKVSMTMLSNMHYRN